jgi:hypothetical protein
MTSARVSQTMLQQALRAWRRRACVDFGCQDSAFDSHALTIVQRPAQSKEKYIAMAATLGTGTVLSVEESWLDLVRGLSFEKHFLAFQPQQLMLPLVEEARRRGVEVTARSAGLGFLPDEVLSAPQLPEGLHVERWEKDACVAWAPTFHNALWDDPDDIDDFLYALVFVDGSSEPQAMAGAWHEGEGLVGSAWMSHTMLAGAVWRRQSSRPWRAQSSIAATSHLLLRCDERTLPPDRARFRLRACDVHGGVRPKPRSRSPPTRDLRRRGTLSPRCRTFCESRREGAGRLRGGPWPR